MGIILIILFLIMLEMIQILLSRFKIVKWIFPVLSFLGSINILLAMIIMTEKSQVINTIIMCIVTLIIVNIPTIVFGYTNHKKFEDKTISNIKKSILIILIVLIAGSTFFFNTNKPTKAEKNDNVANTTTLYIPNGVNVDNGNNTGIRADTLKFNRNKENVTIQVLQNTITKEEVEILITDNNEDQYGWGVEFRVQEKINGEWKDLNYISNDLFWIDIAYQLNKDNQLIQKLDIKKYYGKLNNGIYRIVKPVYDNEYIDIYSNEFEVK